MDGTRPDCHNSSNNRKSCCSIMYAAYYFGSSPKNATVLVSSLRASPAWLDMVREMNKDMFCDSIAWTDFAVTTGSAYFHDEQPKTTTTAVPVTREEEEVENERGGRQVNTIVQQSPTLNEEEYIPIQVKKVLRRYFYDEFCNRLATQYGIPTLLTFCDRVKRGLALNEDDYNHLLFVDAMLSDVRFVAAVEISRPSNDDITTTPERERVQQEERDERQEVDGERERSGVGSDDPNSSATVRQEEEDDLFDFTNEYQDDEVSDLHLTEDPLFKQPFLYDGEKTPRGTTKQMFYDLGNRAGRENIEISSDEEKILSDTSSSDVVTFRRPSRVRDHRSRIQYEFVSAMLKEADQSMINADKIEPDTLVYVYRLERRSPEVIRFVRVYRAAPENGAPAIDLDSVNWRANDLMLRKLQRLLGENVSWLGRPSNDPESFLLKNVSVDNLLQSRENVPNLFVVIRRTAAPAIEPHLLEIPQSPALPVHLSEVEINTLLNDYETELKNKTESQHDGITNTSVSVNVAETTVTNDTSSRPIDGQNLVSGGHTKEAEDVVAMSSTVLDSATYTPNHDTLVLDTGEATNNINSGEAAAAEEPLLEPELSVTGSDTVFKRPLPVRERKAADKHKVRKRRRVFRDSGNGEDKENIDTSDSGDPTLSEDFDTSDGERFPPRRLPSRTRQRVSTDDLRFDLITARLDEADETSVNSSDLEPNTLVYVYRLDIGSNNMVRFERIAAIAAVKSTPPVDLDNVSWNLNDMVQVLHQTTGANIIRYGRSSGDPKEFLLRIISTDRVFGKTVPKLFVFLRRPQSSYTVTHQQPLRS